MILNGVRPNVTVTRTFHTANARLDVQSRTDAYLSIVLAGSYRERIGAAVVECHPMEMRLHPPGEEHSHIIGSSGAHCMIVDLSGDWNESVTCVVTTLRQPLLVRVPGRWAFRAAVNHSLSLETWAANLLDICERQARVQRAADRNVGLRRAIASIDERLNQRLTLIELARDAGLHPTHFARSFRSLTGYTVGEYIRHRRVARAQQLCAAHSSFTLSRVALESGFFDHAHLTRSFRQLLGVTPSEYRKSLRSLFA